MKIINNGIMDVNEINELNRINANSYERRSYMKIGDDMVSIRGKGMAIRR